MQNTDPLHVCSFVLSPTQLYKSPQKGKAGLPEKKGRWERLELKGDRAGVQLLYSACFASRGRNYEGEGVEKWGVEALFEMVISPKTKANCSVACRVFSLCGNGQAEKRIAPVYSVPFFCLEGEEIETSNQEPLHMTLPEAHLSSLSFHSPASPTLNRSN